MFTTIGSFSIFMFIALALLVLGLIFEDRLIDFEEAVIDRLRGRSLPDSESEEEIIGDLWSAVGSKGVLPPAG